MQLKSVNLGLCFGEVIPNASDESHAAESYAVAFCAQEQAHLSVLMAAPIFGIPSAGVLPLAHVLVDEVNAKRRAHAEEAEKRIASAAAIAGIAAEFHIVQNPIRAHATASPRQPDRATSSSFRARRMTFLWTRM